MAAALKSGKLYFTPSPRIPDSECGSTVLADGRVLLIRTARMTLHTVFEMASYRGALIRCHTASACAIKRPGRFP